jgi:hypothetical protein
MWIMKWERRGAASRNHREEGGCKSRKKSQGNVCQGNNPENVFSHSLDDHSPDFAFVNVFNRVGRLKILAKGSDWDGLQSAGEGVMCGNPLQPKKRFPAGLPIDKFQQSFRVTQDLVRVAARFFSGVPHPHLRGVCCPNFFFFWLDVDVQGEIH